MTAEAWAWMGWFLAALITFVAVCEFVYDEYIDPPEDEDDNE